MLGGGGRRVRGGEPTQVCHTVWAIHIRGLSCKERGGLGGVSKLVFGAVTAGEAATAGTWHAPRSATVMEALGYAPFDEPLVWRRAEAILRSLRHASAPGGRRGRIGSRGGGRAIPWTGDRTTRPEGSLRDYHEATTANTRRQTHTKSVSKRKHAFEHVHKEA